MLLESPVETEVGELAQSLTLYTYSSVEDLYRIIESGKTLTRKQLESIVAEVINEFEFLLMNLSQELNDEKLDLAIWFYAVVLLLQRYYLGMAALGRGTWDILRQNGIARVEKYLSEDLTRLTLFTQDIDSGRYGVLGDLSVAAILQRSNMYAGRARFLYWSLWEGPLEVDGTVLMERRYLNPAEHCSDCIRYASMGWQLSGILPDPGDRSECLSNCRCTKDKKLFPTGEV